MPVKIRNAPKTINHPVKPGDQDCAGANHKSAHQERAKDSPKQDAMLQRGRNAEESENHDEHEEVVHGQRLFDQIAREKLQARIAGP